jgi:hypothetical protein
MSSSATSWWLRREHRADRGHDHVVGLVVERQVLCIGLNPLELQPLGLGAGAAGLEQLGRQVARGDLRAALRGRDRRAAAAGGHVEDAHAGRDLAGLHEARPRGSRKVSTMDG